MTHQISQEHSIAHPDSSLSVNPRFRSKAASNTPQQIITAKLDSYTIVKLFVMSILGCLIAILISNCTNNRRQLTRPAMKSLIAFQALDGIYVIQPDGEGLAKVSRDLEVIQTTPSSFSWSPDGQQLTFGAEDERGSSLYVVKTDGSHLTRLTIPDSEKVGALLLPTWSPDSKRIAFSMGTEESVDVYVINADGTEFSNITQDDGYYIVGPWSPDGREIAVLSASKNAGQMESELWVLSVDGSKWQKLATPEDSNIVQYRPMEWSSDGRYILCTVGQLWESTHIIKVATDGSGFSRLTDTSGTNMYMSPTWSPDGNHVAYGRLCPGSGVDDEVCIFVMNADGSDPSQITDGEDLGAGNAAWSADGGMISVCGGDSSIYIMEADGSNPQRVTPDSVNCFDLAPPMWQP